MKENKNFRLLFIFTTLAIDSIGLGIVIPTLPDVIRKFIPGDEMSVSQVYGYFIAVYAVMQFISSPFLGGLSDRFGRRPVLLISLIGAAIDYLFMALAPSLPLLFVGRVISGISGASYTVASAYIADISTDKNRSKNFGVMGAGFGLGFIIGPALGGLLASYGFQYPFLAAAGLNLLNFLFGFFVLPESLLKAAKKKIVWNPFSSIISTFKIDSIRVLVIICGLMQLAGQTHPSVWTLYSQHRYGWTAAQVGISLAVVGILSAVSQGGLTGMMVKWLGERKLLIYGLLGQAISFYCFGLANTPWMLYSTLVVSSLFWAGQPALQSLISREVPSDQQGELQGSLMSMVSLSSIINPLVTTRLFAAFSNPNQSPYLPGSPYFFAATLLFVAWILAVWDSRSSGTKKRGKHAA